MVIVFQGDSITDGGRFLEPNGIGKGYVAQVKKFLEERYPGTTVYNRGVGGNSSVDLVARWQEDTLSLKPDIVVVMIGVNDIWKKFNKNDPTSDADYEKNVETVLQASKNQGSKIVLIEPYLFYHGLASEEWREEYEGKRKAARKLAEKYADAFIPAQDVFMQMEQVFNWNLMVNDGVHPTAFGVRLLASMCIEALENLILKK